VHVSAFQEKQAAKIQARPKFPVASKGAQANAAVQMRMADYFRRAAGALPHKFLFLRRQFFNCAEKRRALIDVHNGANFPLLRSALIAAKSAAALFSTCSGVTPNSVKGLGAPMK
jgi:hypothetical protein